MAIISKQIKKESSIENITDKITKYTLGPSEWNSYLIKDDKNILIDAMYPLDEKVDILVLTHAHYDHVFFAKEIVDKNSCEVYASKETARHIKKGDEIVFPKGPLSPFLPSHAWKSPYEILPVKITKYLKEGDLIKTKSFSFEVLESPGHCPGEISLYDRKKGILFSGDTWVSEEKTGWWGYPGGNSELLKKSIERLKKLKVKLLCPGHYSCTWFQ